ncbi:MAG: family 10 glycosylhydrolase [Caldithrix sp.]|nr:family 10 glycosylhydrolase [Caldithrix sp.]
MNYKVILFIVLIPILLYANSNQDFRGIWVVTWEHINRYDTVEENKARVRQILDNIKKANMNAVLWQARQSGTAYYNSSYEPWGYYAGKSYPGYDPLAYAIQEAHKRGIELHAWFNVFQTSSTDAGTPAAEHPEWICTDRYGNPMTSYRSVSPGLQAVRDYTVKVAMEIVRNYDIDGFHLDYVRWNEYDTDDMANPASMKEQVSQLDGLISESRLQKLSDVQGDRFIFDTQHPFNDGVPDGFDSWADWRRWSVTEFVRTLHDSIQAVKPWVRLSPAALGKYNWSGWNGYHVVFQDAALWFNEGYIEQLMPMLYHWTSGEGIYGAVAGDCPECWSQWIQPGLSNGRIFSGGPGSYRLDQENVWDNHEDIVSQCRTIPWHGGFQFFSYASWKSHNYWERAAGKFFQYKTKVPLITDSLSSQPPTPSIAKEKIDSLNYRLSIDPGDSLAVNHWFYVYRSADDVLSTNDDPLVHIEYGTDAFSFVDSYLDENTNVGGVYSYFATVADRHRKESSISDSVRTDSIPTFIQPPSAKPLMVRILGEDASTLKIVCEPVERASGYRALLSINGTTFPDTVEAESNEIQATGLNANQVYYIKVQAFNRNGAAPATDELYAGVPSSSPHKVLIVNGFDRSTNVRQNYINRYADPVNDRGYPFSYVLNESVINGKIALEPFDTIIWILGDESTADETLNDIEQDSVKAFLQRGGRLLVSGAEIGWDLDANGTTADRQFYNNFLKADYVADAPAGQNNEYFSCTAIEGNLFTGIDDFNFDDGTHGSYNIDWPDAISGRDGAQHIIRYKEASTQNIAGIAYEGMFPNGSAEGKLLYMGVPFETIYPEASRFAIMEKAFDFFEGKISNMEDNLQITRDFRLYQNYPNPFNPKTTIGFQVPQRSHIRLRVYNALGQVIQTLIDKSMSAGHHEIKFNGSNLASGVYFYEIKSQGIQLRRRMIFLK